MTSRHIEADLTTLTDVVGVSSRTALAIPPSATDAAAGLIRVVTGGIEITLAYDPVMEQP